MSVQSEGEGEGCIFSIELPLSDKPFSNFDEEEVSFYGDTPVEDWNGLGEVNNVTPPEDAQTCFYTPEKAVDTSISSIITSIESPVIEDDVHKIKRALIVDDTFMNRKMLKRMFEGKIEILDEAKDGHIAVDMVRESMEKCDQPSFDLILMDFIMPVMNGPDASRHIRQLGYKGVIVGVTGNTMQFDIDTFKSNGVDYVLPKPLNMSALESLLRRNNNNYLFNFFNIKNNLFSYVILFIS